MFSAQKSQLLNLWRETDIKPSNVSEKGHFLALTRKWANAAFLGED
jgi:hypothetical protein